MGSVTDKLAGVELSPDGAILHEGLMFQAAEHIELLDARR
jgi:hypothetical protein